MVQTKAIDVRALIDNQKFSWFRVSIIVWSWTFMLLDRHDMPAVPVLCCAGARYFLDKAPETVGRRHQVPALSLATR